MAAPDFAETSVRGDRLAGAASRVTAEHIAYIGVAVLAAVLRFVDLGLSPLNPGEAEQALAVWDFWQPGGPAALPGSPAYFTISVFLTLVAGFSDTAMRLVPAVFGFALVLTPWLLRHRVGRLGALVAALLLAVSPLQAIVARTAGGQSIALLAGMLVLVGWLRYQEEARPRWLYVLAVGVALGLTSAPLFFGIVLTLLIAWFAQRLVGPALIRDADGERAALVRPSRRELVTAASVGLATFLLLAMAFFLALRGLGSAADLLADWLRLFQFTSSGYLLSGPFAVLLRYEVGMLLIGLPAAVWAAFREKPFPIFLVYWVLGALLLMLLQPGVMDNVLLLTLPGYLLVGRFVNDIFERASSPWWWAFGLGVLFAGAVIYLNLVRYARLAGLQGVPDPTYHLLLAILAFGTMLALTALLFSWDRAGATKGLVSGLLALLVVVTWGSAWWLSHHAANDSRERWVSAGTDADIRLIRETVGELSWRASNSANDVDLTSAVDTPALRWYLRDFGRATFANTLPASTASPVLITPLEYEAQVASNYIGAEYSYSHPNTVHNIERIDALRWWLFRQSPVPVAEQKLILWLRSDIAEGES